MCISYNTNTIRTLSDKKNSMIAEKYILVIINRKECL